MGTSLDDLERQCRDRMATGVDGLFTFEGQHDPFLPLAHRGARRSRPTS